MEPVGVKRKRGEPKAAPPVVTKKIKEQVEYNMNALCALRQVINVDQPYSSCSPENQPDRRHLYRKFRVLYAINPLLQVNNCSHVTIVIWQFIEVRNTAQERIDFDIGIEERATKLRLYRLLWSLVHDPAAPMEMRYMPEQPEPDMLNGKRASLYSSCRDRDKPSNLHSIFYSKFRTMIAFCAQRHRMMRLKH